MAFPTKWVQVWIEYPFATIDAIPSFLQWFSYEPAIPFGFNFVALANAFSDWWMAGMGGLVYTQVPNTNPIGVYYLSGYTPFIEIVSIDKLAGPFYANALTLPNPNAAIVQRFCDSTDRRRRGRFYVSGIGVDGVEDGHMHPGWVFDATTRCDTMSTPLVVDGVTFTPVLVSYADAAMYPITKFSASGRLGTVMRRKRSHRHGWIRPSDPKTPPP